MREGVRKGECEEGRSEGAREGEGRETTIPSLAI